MKKHIIIALLLTLSMILTLASCKTDTSDETPTTDTPTTATPTTEAPTTEAPTTETPTTDNGGDGPAPVLKYSWATQGGDGTAADPFIINQTNFIAFYEFYLDGGWNGFMPNADEHFKLATDVVVNEGDAENWATTPPAKTYDKPMGEFHGTFDGNGKSISGLYVKTVEAGRRATLFHQIAADGVVKNLSIVNSYFEIGVAEPGAHVQAGSIAGRIIGGTIENCYSDAIIRSTVGSDVNFINTVMGGMVGMSQGENSKISNCVFAGSIYFENKAGVQGKGAGMVAYVNSGTLTVTNCLNLGTIHTKNAGGILGGNDMQTTVINCVNLSDALTGNYVGDIVAYNANLGCTINSVLISDVRDTPAVLGNDAANNIGANHLGTVTSMTLAEFCASDLDGWFYANGYLPTPIEGLQVAVPQA